MIRPLALGLSAFLTATLVMSACGDDETSQQGTANCQPSDPACPALAVQSDCLALVDNSDKDVFALRLAQLSVKAPEALTGQTVYSIVADGVNPKLDACGVSGMGTFNLITIFDRTNGKLRIGGAKPVADPTTGYCFAYDAVHEIEPFEVNVSFGPDGSFTPDPIERIVVPIYLDEQASDAVYLPLRKGQIVGGKMSADQNCIGAFNGDGLEPLNFCKPDISAGIEYYVNAGTLEGHITLEDADAVQVDLLQQSLCVLLSGDPNTYGDGADPQKCTRDGSGKLELEGDWCSTTDSAGGCKDAFRLTAELAGSAVALRDDCPMEPGGSGGGSSSSGGGNTGSGGAGGS